MIHEPLIPNDVAKAEDVNRELVKLFNHANNPGTLTADEIVVTGDVKAGGFVLNGAAVDGGWTPGLPVPTIVNNGNGSQTATWTGSDQTGKLSAAMRLQGTRPVATQTQVASLDENLSQYFSKSSPSGITFASEFTTMAWVKLESYQSEYQYIISRYSSTGWGIRLTNSGDGRMDVFSVGSGTILSTTIQSIPLNKWVHIAAAVDIGTSVRVYFDGVEVPTTSTVSTGTAVTQNGNLEVGRAQQVGNGYFDGEIASAGVFDSALSETLIREYMTRGLTGSETNCVFATNLNGDAVDLSSNGNDLTPMNSAGYADDSPYGNGLGGLLDYAIISKIDFVGADTVAIIQTPTGSIFPDSGLTALAYSVHNAYRFPSEKSKWTLSAINRRQIVMTLPAAQVYASTVLKLAVPIGDWTLTHRVSVFANGTTGDMYTTLTSKAAGATITNEEDISQSNRIGLQISGKNSFSGVELSKEVSLPSTTTYEHQFARSATSITTMGIDADNQGHYIKAEYGLL